MSKRILLIEDMAKEVHESMMIVWKANNRELMRKLNFDLKYEDEVGERVLELIADSINLSRPTMYCEVADIVIIKVTPDMKVSVANPVDGQFMEQETIKEIPPQAMTQSDMSLEIRTLGLEITRKDYMEVYKPEEVQHMEERLIHLKSWYHGCTKCLFPPRYFIEFNNGTQYFCDEHGDFSTLEAVAERLNSEVGEYWGSECQCSNCGGTGQVPARDGELKPLGWDVPCTLCNESGWMVNLHYDKETGGEL